MGGLQKLQTMAGCLLEFGIVEQVGSNGEVVDVPAGADEVAGGAVVDCAVVPQSVEIAAKRAIDHGWIVKVDQTVNVRRQKFRIPSRCRARFFHGSSRAANDRRIE